MNWTGEDWTLIGAFAVCVLLAAGAVLLLFRAPRWEMDEHEDHEGRAG